MTRVAVIGIAGGGKSTMARKLAAAHHLPYFAVDKLQYRLGWQPTPKAEYDRLHAELVAQEAWVIDGFGSWESVERRFERADTIILVDHPLWVHFWWAAERQIACVTAERPDGPDGCPMLPMTQQVFKAIWDIHHELRPRLLDLISQQHDKTIYQIHSPEELDRFTAEYCRA